MGVPVVDEHIGVGTGDRGDEGGHALVCCDCVTMGVL